MSSSGKTFLKIFFSFWALLIFISLCVAILSIWNRNQEAKQFPIELAIVKEIHSVKIGKGSYLVHLTKSSQNAMVDGNAFYKAYAIGEEVQVLLKPNEFRILHARNSWLISAGLSALLLFFLGLFAFLIYGKEKINFVALAMGGGILMMGVSGYLLMQYERSAQEVFERNSKMVMGELIGFAEKECERKNKDTDKITKYPCYAQQIIYELPSGQKHQWQSTHFGKNQIGTIGQKIQMSYLKSNPTEAKITRDPKKEKLFHLAMYAFIGLISLFGATIIYKVLKS